MTDQEWYALVKAGEDAGWKRVWEDVVEPESTSLRSAEMMKRYSLTAGDLMGMLYEDMLGKRKIDLYRGEGSFQGWLRSYVRGYVLNADPNKHGEISLEGAAAAGAEDGAAAALDIPQQDLGLARNEIWSMTHLCFRDLWNQDPERALVLILKTRFHLTSEETKEMLEISSAANVDQLFSRAVKFMRQDYARRDKNGY
ncbi:MAG: sigma-70 family RNA polymerase sigma factor [Kiritimatiellae bacterium]|nr:sigma-70 family RNA polymerase sigma factor [Kiritimatiellia bacterium]